MAEASVEEELDALKEDLARLRADIGDLAGVLKDLGVERAEHIRSSVEDEVRTRREALRRRLDSTRARGRKAVDDLEDQIEGHPLSSLLAAFGMGFIIGKLLDLGGRR